MGASDSADNGGDVTVKMEKAGGGHGLPILANGCDFFPVGLEPL